MQEKIKKLLALASSSNKNEAEMALKKARELMLKHNIETIDNLTPNDMNETTIKLGQRRPTHTAYVVHILQKYFFVKCIYKYNHSVSLTIIGSEENRANAIYIYHALSATFRVLGKGIRLKGTFYEGLMRGFTEKLDEQRTATTQNGKDVILVSDSLIKTYVNDKYPKLGKVKTSRKDDYETYEKGKKLGKNISINKPLSSNNAKPLYIN